MLKWFKKIFTITYTRKKEDKINVESEIIYNLLKSNKELLKE